MGKTVKRAATAVATGGLSEFTHGSDAFGAKRLINAVSGGGKNYTPTMLGKEDPKLLLAQSGGAPLLTQIALGASVDDALAGYFGRSKGQDWDAYLKNLSPDERAAIDNVRNQLTQIQSNTELRNKAVEKITQDFPNVVSMTAPQVKAAKQAAGEEFDQASQQYMDLALSKVAAKYNAGGMLSSGAAAAATARAGADLGLQRLGYQDEQGSQALGLLSQGWQARYNEANALRNFQNTMLGQGAGQGFSAVQAGLQRNLQRDMTNQQAQQQADALKAQESGQMFGALGSLAGTALGATFGGPIGASMGAQIGGQMSGSGGITGTFQKSARGAGVNDYAYAPPRLRYPGGGGY